MIHSSQSMSCDSRTPSREVRDTQQKKDYDIDLLSKVIEYNHKRYLAFKNQEPFEKNYEYEKILNARVCKVGRIKRRLVFLLISMYGLLLLHLVIIISIKVIGLKEI